MPTPVGPAPPDPNDPDLRDWDVDHDDTRYKRRPLQLIVISTMVLALVLQLVVNLL
jgi:hypothetical protein